jgi:hypothetical protein
MEGGQRSRRGWIHHRGAEDKVRNGFEFRHSASHASCKSSAVRVGQLYPRSPVTVPLTQPVARSIALKFVAGRLTDRANPAPFALVSLTLVAQLPFH